MNPLQKFINDCQEMNLLAGLPEIEYGQRWLQSLYDLYISGQAEITQAFVQETIIFVGQFMKILSWPDQSSYLRYCEKLLPVDCLLEILDKYPVLQGSYPGENKAIRSYINIML